MLMMTTTLQISHSAVAVRSVFVCTVLCPGCIGFFACFWFVTKIYSRHAASLQSNSAMPSNDGSKKMMPVSSI